MSARAIIVLGFVLCIAGLPAQAIAAEDPDMGCVDALAIMNDVHAAALRIQAATQCSEQGRILPNQRTVSVVWFHDGPRLGEVLVSLDGADGFHHEVAMRERVYERISASGASLSRGYWSPVVDLPDGFNGILTATVTSDGEILATNTARSTQADPGYTREGDGTCNAQNGDEILAGDIPCPNPQPDGDATTGITLYDDADGDGERDESETSLTTPTGQPNGDGTCSIRNAPTATDPVSCPNPQVQQDEDGVTVYDDKNRDGQQDREGEGIASSGGCVLSVCLLTQL